jgi:hypothetical protein
MTDTFIIYNGFSIYNGYGCMREGYDCYIDGRQGGVLT